jgi:glycogen debranching enzyme
VLYQELRVVNHGLSPVDFRIAIRFAADFADIYEVRGMRRQARGNLLEPALTDDAAALRYRGLDNIERRTVLNFSRQSLLLTATCAAYSLCLGPSEEHAINVAVACERESIHRTMLSFAGARDDVRADLERQAAQFVCIETGNGQFDALVRRSAADIHMLTTLLPLAPIPMRACHGSTLRSGAGASSLRWSASCSIPR